MSIEYRGETFEGYNKPKRTPNHSTNSHAVLVKEGDRIELIRFGAKGVSGSPPKDNESPEWRARREAFYARHKADIKRGRFSAAYWAWFVKWTNRFKDV